MQQVRFRKGHGTGNDFVLLPDAGVPLTAARVRALCHRRFGVGADGVLRVLPAGEVPEYDAAGARWFMDYWNADGTYAEMCGNGARVFARHLVDAGLEQPGEFWIGTRGGPRRVLVPDTGPITVDMGRATPGSADVSVTLRERTWPATGAFVPNPHAVAFVDADLAALGPLDGARVTPGQAFPDGVNIEFVTVDAPDRIRLRVLERGAGETLSCGTGACAAAWVHRRRHRVADLAITVAVPGGELVVTETGTGSLLLTGPAAFVADGVIDARMWS